MSQPRTPPLSLICLTAASMPLMLLEPFVPPAPVTFVDTRKVVVQSSPPFPPAEAAGVLAPLAQPVIIPRAAIDATTARFVRIRRRDFTAFIAVSSLRSPAPSGPFGGARRPRLILAWSELRILHNSWRARPVRK